MSRSTPVCMLKCNKCRAKAPFGERYGDKPRSYINVRVVGTEGNKAVCKCQTCGHEYLSRSAAAIRAMRRLEKHAANEVGGGE